MKELQLKRGSSVLVAAYVPLLGEPLWDTEAKILTIGDGVTPGGLPLNKVASAIKLATARSIAFTGDATGTFSFDGAADVSAALTLSSTVTAGTYTRVTVDAKGRVTVGQSSALAIANGGTGATTAAAALAALGGAPTANPTFSGTPLSTTPVVGTATSQIATAAMLQNEFANKRAWTNFTPTVVAGTGTYTTATATGKYMVVFGICYFSITVSLTVRNGGTFPIVTVPVTGLAGLSAFVNPAFNTANNKGGSARFIDTTRFQVFAADGTELSSADGQNIIISGQYPVA